MDLERRTELKYKTFLRYGVGACKEAEGEFSGAFCEVESDSEVLFFFIFSYDGDIIRLGLLLLSFAGVLWLRVRLEDIIYVAWRFTTGIRRTTTS